MNASAAVECERFQGRLREICTGSALLPIEKINAYRESWGLSRLPDDGRVIEPHNLFASGTSVGTGSLGSCGCKRKSKRATSMPPDTMPGAQLVKYYESLGLPSCQACKDLAGRMDQWGVAGCRERMDDIVANILPRAQAWVKAKVSWVGALFPTFEKAALEFKIRRDVIAAIDAAEVVVKSLEAKRASEKKVIRTKIKGCCLTSAKGRRAQQQTSEAKSQLAIRQAKLAAHVPVLKANVRPLVNPTRNLMFHIYPLKRSEWNWRWHIEQIRRFAPVFNGKIVIGITHDAKTSTPEDVQAMMADIPVTDWVIAPNTRQLAETATFVRMLSLLQSGDSNAITFRGHTKGVTHQRGGFEQEWAKLMWETCMDLPGVDRALAGHVVAGSMMSREPLVTRKSGNFFFAGSFYWFTQEVFNRNWSEYEQNRWWVEYWPGQVATVDEAACLCHDFAAGAVLNHSYWETNVVPDWSEWRAARQSPAKVPVFINVRNRYSTTRKLAEQVAQLANAVPVLIDNASDWQPLLDWYDSPECPYQVIRLQENMGHHAPWKAKGIIPTGDEFIAKHGGRHYVVTDCDLDLDGVPVDVLDVLRKPFTWNPNKIVKSGLSLRIDDLPPWQTDAKQWESQFWARPVKGGLFYYAPIDTTFAMYDCMSPLADVMSTKVPALRSAPPYCARHVPWYLDGNNLDAENQHYFATANSSNSWKPRGNALTAGYAN